MGEEEEEGAEGRRRRPRLSWCVIFTGGAILLLITCQQTVSGARTRFQWTTQLIAAHVGAWDRETGKGWVCTLRVGC